mgnify:CR=1 FL=1
MLLWTGVKLKKKHQPIFVWTVWALPINIPYIQELVLYYLIDPKN